MFNITTNNPINSCEAPKLKLEQIISDYLSVNQQTENVFFNGLKELNRQRIQTQTQNWSNFIIKLQSVHSIATQSQSQALQTKHIKTETNHKEKSQASTESEFVPQISLKKKFKCVDEYECVLSECNKIYTTKGNLNRHLKDYHHLNPDLTHISKTQTSPKQTANNALSHSQQQFICIKPQCNDKNIIFYSINDMKEHGINQHHLSDDAITKYLSHCKQTAIHNNTAPPSLPPTPSHNTHRPHSTKLQFMTGINNNNLNAFNNNCVKNNNPFSAMPSPVINTQNMLSPLVLKQNNNPLPVFNACNNSLPIFSLNNNIKFAAQQQQQHNAQRNLNPFNTKSVPMPMLQLLSQNGNKINVNNNTAALLMQLQNVQNNNKMNGMKQLISHILNKNNNNNNSGQCNYFPANMAANNLVNNQNILNSFNMNKNNNLRVTNSTTTVATSHNMNMNANDNRNEVKDSFNGLNALVQAAEALDEKKKNEKKKNKKKKSWRKRKIDHDPDYTPPASSHVAKKRKLSKHDQIRMDNDEKTGVCSLCKKTQRKLSIFNWKIHLASDHKFVCNKCTNKYTKQSYLNTHIEECHE